ncbi:cyclopropane-fatty-acyl-phospholipid synthase family protein [Verrucomicrobia bacterium]|nr:cyclopropane-fatty-acyl-phospholipid synthase family protein [Verrucomicrobiota bacterium]
MDALCEKIVLKALKKMQVGKLRLILANGSECLIGDPLSVNSASIKVVSGAFFRKCVLYGDIGFGEAYVAGDWETDDIQAVIRWFILNIESSPAMSGSSAKKRLVNLFVSLNRIYHLLRPNSLRNSPSNISEHYDLGNKFYGLFLDRSMTYSCALFQSKEDNLESAQEAKYDRLCQKLRLEKTDHVLEIGCGWGGFCCYAAKQYGCRITAITISDEQLKYARAQVEREGLSDLIDVRLCDYRHMDGSFDKIASIEMLEAVGHQYLETYFAKCASLLKKDGLLGLQMITCPDSRYDELRRGVDWIQKHIFPGSLLLSVGRVNQAINRTGDLFLSDLRDMGSSYVRTLSLWQHRFNSNHDALHELGFDAGFIRKWNYYFSYCEAAFAMGNISVVQALYTRPNNLSLTEKG